MSRNFICTVAGIGMTIFAWYGPWAWPAAPAFAVIDLVFGSGAAYQELPYSGRAAVLVGLIFINVAFWSLAAAMLFGALRRLATAGTKHS